MKTEEVCMFRDTCKKFKSEECNPLCYPFVLLHGQKGTGGFWRTSGVPAKYKKLRIIDLPIKEANPKAFAIATKYIEKIEEMVEEKGVGLFFYPELSETNTMGTGTGKTTTAVTILNEYIIFSTKRHLKGVKEIKGNPALFIKASELQNKYNAQFRGNIEMQQEASCGFYKLKQRMKDVKLLVMDDVAIRDTTEAFKNELFEIIDFRATEERATIFTSNITLNGLNKFLGERIVSRIEGMAVPVQFYGNDFRKGGLF